MTLLLCFLHYEDFLAAGNAVPQTLPQTHNQHLPTVSFYLIFHFQVCNLMMSRRVAFGVIFIEACEAMMDLDELPKIEG